MYSSLSREFIAHNHLDDSHYDQLRMKFSKLSLERRASVKNRILEKWNEAMFFPLPDVSVIESTQSAVKSVPSVCTISFEEDLSRLPYKHIDDLTTKGLNIRLDSLMSHLKTVAEKEKVSPKTIATYLLKLCSQKERDFSSSKLCKEIITKGNYSTICSTLCCDKAAFLMDSLEIGKLKYIKLRRILLTEGFKLPGYNRLAIHRANICLISDIHLVKRDYPIGVGISYRLLLTNTIDRILSYTNYVNYPVEVRISDGLDGSGCHRLYQQVMPHPDLTTKNILLFGFKVIHINSADGKFNMEESCSKFTLFFPPYRNSCPS